MLKQVLDETKQIPRITTSAGHQCSEKEEKLDEKMKNSVVQQTIALMDYYEQIREFQDIVCRVSLPEETTLKLQDRADAGATAAPSYSIQMIPTQQQEHQQTTKLLPPPTKRQDEAHVSMSGSKEPVTGTSTGSD